ncbi:hypothetical protein P9112_007736 [Eukaryota sp. TZLM1-RC]
MQHTGNLLLERLRSEALKHTIRMDDSFLDFDTLRRGKITKTQFERVVSSLFPIAPHELSTLSSLYQSSEDPSIVSYKPFLRDIHLVFSNPDLTKKPSSPVVDQSRYHRLEETLASLQEVPDRFSLILDAIKQAVSSQRIVVKSFFVQMDRDNDGCLAKSEFVRLFPFQLSPSDLDLLCDYYRRPCNCPSTFLVDYRKFHKDVTPIDESCCPPPKKERVQLSDEGQSNTPESRSVLDSIAKQCHLNGIDLEYFFKQFDPLNKGRICQSYFLTALGMSKLNLTQEEYMTLLNTFARKDDVKMFDYKILCREVSSVTIVDGLEKSRDFDLETLQSKSSTFKGLSGSRKMVNRVSSEVMEILSRLANDVLVKRILVKSVFEDFDRSKRGYVTPKQFEQSLSMLGFVILPHEMELLINQFKSEVNHDLIDYLGFLTFVDPQAPKI